MLKTLLRCSLAACLSIAIAIACLLPGRSYQLDALPQSAWQENWGTQGSCCYAATASMLKQAGYQKEAEYIRTHYRGGANYLHVCSALEAVGLGHDYTDCSDLAFVEAICNCGKTCVVGVRGGAATVPYEDDKARHALLVFHCDDSLVGINDCNPINPRNRWVTRQEFQRDWLGWAVTLVD